MGSHGNQVELACVGVRVDAAYAAEQRWFHRDDDAGTCAGTRAPITTPPERCAPPRGMEPLNDAHDHARRHERHHGIYFGGS